MSTSMPMLSGKENGFELTGASQESQLNFIDFPLRLSSKDYLTIENELATEDDKHYLKLLELSESSSATKDNYSFVRVSPTIINRLDKSQGAAPLHYACMNGNLRMVEFLLDNEADVNICDKINQVTPLVCAAAHGYLGIVIALLEHNCDINAGLNNCANSGSALLWAVRGNHPTVVRYLLDQGACQTPAVLFSETPIHAAVISGSLEILEMLINARSANVQANLGMGNEKNTPLHLAASGNFPNSVEICKILLDQGNAETNAVNSYGKTSLHEAGGSEIVDIVKLLLGHWADVNAKDKHGRTPLFYAISDADGARKCLEMLITRGKCDVNHQDNQGDTVLHIAARQGAEGAAEILLKNKADFSIKNNCGISSLSLLRRHIPELSTLLYKAFDHAVTTTKFEESSPENRLECRVKVDFQYVLPAQSQIGELQKPLKINRLAVLLSGHDQYAEMKSFRVETSKLQCLVTEDQASLLSHPVIHSFLELKWHTARSFFFPTLLFKLFLVLLFSAYAQMPYVLNQRNVTFDDNTGTRIMMSYIAGRNDSNETNLESIWIPLPTPQGTSPPAWFKGLNALLVTMAILQGVMELGQILRAPKQQLRTLHPYISLAVLLIIIAYMRPGTWKRVDNPFQRSMAALGVLLAWIDIWIEMSRFPKYGLSIRVFIQVFKTFSKFVLPHTCLLAGFVLSFTLLFPRSGEFSSVAMAIAKIIRIMAGDITIVPEGMKALKPEDSLKDKFSQIFVVYIYTTYVLIVAIVLMNLLIGLAVNDIQGIYREASIDKLVKQTILLNTLESSFSGRLIKKWIPLGLFSKRVNLFHPYTHNKTCTFKPFDSRDSKLSHELTMALLDIGRANQAKSTNSELDNMKDDAPLPLPPKNLRLWKKAVSKLKTRQDDHDKQRILMEKISELISSYVTNAKN